MQQDKTKASTADDSKEIVRYNDITHISASLEQIRRMVAAGKIEEINPVKFISKQMIVKEYFLEMMANGKKNIYVNSHEIH